MLDTYLSFHYFLYLLVLVEFHHLNSCLTLLLGFFQSQLHSLLNPHLHWHHNFLLLLVSCLIRYKCEIDFNFPEKFINVNKYETIFFRLIIQDSTSYYKVCSLFVSFYLWWWEKTNSWFWFYSTYCCVEKYFKKKRIWTGEPRSLSLKY